MENWQIGVVIALIMIAGFLYLKTEHFTNGNDKPYIVLFSQDWCPACQEFKPTWAKLKRLKVITDVVTLVELDPLPFNIGSYPTIRFYRRDPMQYPDDFVLFKGKRNLGQLMKFVSENIKH